MHGDIGIGLIVAAVIVCPIFGIESTWTHLLFGSLFAILPDIDTLPEYFRHGKVAAHAGNCRDHRDGLHYPVLFIPIGTLVLLLTAGGIWATIFGVCTFLHFVHDSVGTGWGVKWLWPFDRRSFKFFTDRQNEYGWQRSEKLFVVSWTPEELREAIRLYGVRDWFPVYIKSVQFVFESWLFLLGLLIVTLHIFSVLY